MTARTRRKLLFRSLLVIAILLGLVRGWIRGVESAQSDIRTEGFTVRIDSEEIGIRLDNLTGELELLGSAGYQWVVPGLNEVFRISRAPVTIVFGGEQPDRPGLEVRSADGSAFVIEEVRLTYRIGEPGALRFLRDSGTDTRRAADWVASLARPILREEFGAQTVQEVTDALVVDAARGRAIERLSIELERHGIELIGITASKPDFDRKYETAIAKRKVADQEVERLTRDQDLKLREREERIAKTQAEILSRDALLDDELEQERILADTNAIKTLGAAETWRLKRLAEANSYAMELDAKAKTVRAQGEANIALFASELLALEGHGAAAIRERWIANLAKTQFHMTPLSVEGSTEGLHWAQTILGGKP